MSITALRLAMLAAAMLLSSCSHFDPPPVALASTPEAVSSEAFPEEGYTLSVETITQPIDHADPAAGAFRQQVLILRPDGAPDDAPVFFMLGNETDSTPQRLRALYRNYGSPKDVIFITADHRGYGQSIPEQDQAVPAYVTTEAALADYDRLLRLYKRRFTGSWMGGGCSYGGALAINLAHDHPEHFAVTIASSAPTRFAFETPEYAMQAEANLGPELSASLKAHMAALTPAAPYDDTWRDRERLMALISGMSQLEELQPLKPAVARIAALPTAAFLEQLEKGFPPELLARLDDWAVRRRPLQSLSADAVRHGNYNWYTWKYQQCTQTGTFFTGGIFPHTRTEHIADCRASFGLEPRLADAPVWPVAAMLDKVATPILVVSGGRDPWMQVGVKPSHRYRNIDYAFYPDALHCPDVYGAKIGSEVFARARTLAK